MGGLSSVSVPFCSGPVSLPVSVPVSVSVSVPSLLAFFRIRAAVLAMKMGENRPILIACMLGPCLPSDMHRHRSLLAWALNIDDARIARQPHTRNRAYVEFRGARPATSLDFPRALCLSPIFFLFRDFNNRKWLFGPMSCVLWGPSLYC
jgi:hypothetical protein